jgi:SRSO17 transposase
MSLLEHPKAVELLNDARVTAALVRGCQERVQEYLQRYLPLFYREEQRELATVVVQGKLSHLQRKTLEPIAYAADRERKPVQHFVGAGKWDDEAVTSELRRHVSAEIGDAQGTFIVDGSGFAKKGTESCGVARQWCGRLGKIENCQVGVFLGYASVHGQALLDRQLYLPEDWANAKQRRRKCHVPKEIVFQEKWRIALDLIDRGRDVPHGWLTADDEFGRVTDFRAGLRLRHLRYVVDVPANTLVREVARKADGNKPAFERIEAWAARQPASRWKTITIREGEKGPLKVRALKARVQTKDANGCVGPTETAIVRRTLDAEKRLTYHFSNAARDEALWRLVFVGNQRQRIEVLFQEGKGEIGLGHYEVRSWVGWHHHMTLSLLALWLLELEKLRVGGKNTGHDGAANPGVVRPFVAAPAAQPRANRPRDQPRVAPNRRSTHISLPRSDGPVPTTPNPSAARRRAG